MTTAVGSISGVSRWQAWLPNSTDTTSASCGARARMVDAWAEAPANVRAVTALIWTACTGFVRFRLVVALLLRMAASASTALGPVALKLVVDRFTGHADTGSNFRAAVGL